MSDSRLEKFIYAICSMDVSDLPVPLSRIEKLWNCLITGETPDFEPLSRNEKYLMAMLDRYDISNLPAPTSRGEKLLYKIAVGETDLSDVPGYLSRYEELLKYLIENGGISGSDFEYVLYTLNQSLYTLYTTAEKPVKSAILKGLTLVNLSENLNTITRRLDFWYTNEMLMDNIEKLKRNTYYTVLYRIENLNGNHENYNGNEVGIGEIGYEKNLPPTDIQTELDKNGGWCKIKFQLTDSFMSEYSTYKHLYIRPIRRSTAPVESETIDYTIRGFAILEGDYMTNPIPFNEVFEGMQSVKLPVLTTTGKNLFDLTGKVIYSENNLHQIQNNEVIIENTTYGYYYCRIQYFNLKPNEKYIISYNREVLSGTPYEMVMIQDENRNALDDETRAFTAPLNGKIQILFYSGSSNKMGKIRYYNIQLEEGSVATSYEPYKTNILTVNEPVELRGIGEVQDTLDLMTGEMTERIGEIVLDGSENWANSDNSLANTHRFSIALPDFKSSGLLFNDGGFKNITSGTSSEDTKNIQMSGTSLYLRIDRSVADDVFALKDYLSKNNLTIYGELAENSIKTVDLTTVDQDGQPTQLGTFENVTNVSLEAENLIPEVEMEVATNLLEDTVFNLTNTFNTLYPTAAKPVVDGMLYGQTLVNLATQKSGRFNGTRFLRIPLSYTLKSNTNYFVNFIIKESTLTDGVTCRFKNASTGITLGALKSSGIIATNANVADILEIYIENTDDVTNGLDAIIDDIMVIEYQEGMENWNTPYFEGMKSVQAPGVTMVGKNLFDGVSYIDGFIANSNNYTVSPDTNVTSIIFNVNKNTDYILSAKTNFNRSIIGGSVQPITIGTKTTKIEGYRVSNTLKFNSGEFTNIIIYLNSSKIDIEDIQVEEGSVSTPYEPYKSTTLSTPSDLTLRKVGEAQDELNVMTGEVVERIDETVLIGNEYWDIVNDTFRSSIIKDKVIKLETQADRDKIVISCDRYPSRTYNDPWMTNSGNFISLTVGKAIAISDASFTTVEEWKEYLSQNPLTIKFVLATPTTKTVDLTVVNQDGNETKLRTFEDTTHVLLNSEGVPMSKASLTVRTKIPSASSTSLLMDDISTEQQQLESTVDEQSNNVDAIMMATTEIYEETL